MKTHFKDTKTVEDLPEEEKIKRAKEGTALAVCGYVRRVTTDPSHVSCYQCQRIIEKSGNYIHVRPNTI